MNKYNPHIHHRRSIRLKGYDYAQAGLYFVTICCDNRICRFGNIDNGEMILNEFGTIAYNEWQKLSERFNNFELDVFQIMPNHIQGIIVLNNVGATLAVAQNGGGDTQNGDVDTQNGGQRNDNIGATARVAPTISDIVGAYKSLVANGCLEIYKTRNETMGKLWQRNYYEHIIRNKKSYETISNYIINNPAKWAEDKFYSKNA